MSETNVSITNLSLGKTRITRRTGDTRLLVAVSGPQTLGPLLQESWVDVESGEIEWRSAPTVFVTVEEYNKALRNE